MVADQFVEAKAKILQYIANIKTYRDNFSSVAEQRKWLAFAIVESIEEGMAHLDLLQPGTIETLDPVEIAYNKARVIEAMNNVRERREDVIK